MSLSKKKRSGVILSFLITVVLPALILLKFSGEDQLGAWKAFLLALALPVTYSIIDFFQQKSVHWIALLGLINVLFTGGFGLLELEGFWFALKEASVPFIIAVVLLISNRWEKPLIERIFLNKTLFDLEALQKALEENNAQEKFRKLTRQTCYIFCASFCLSSLLNFFLAYYLLESPVGTAEFNQELAHMQLMSYPIIVLPSLTVATIGLLFFVRSITKITGRNIDFFYSKNINF